MSKPGASPPPYREPMATLTEEDYNDQCARPTVRPPVPVEDLVRQLMAQVDGEPPPAPVQIPKAPPAPKAPQPRHDEFDDLHLDALEAEVEADLLNEIGAAYLEQLGDRADVPYMVMPPEQALHMQLDHWAGFLLSMVDGRTPIGDIVDASAMPEVEALRVLDELRERGLIGVRRPGRRTGQR